MLASPPVIDVAPQRVMRQGSGFSDKQIAHTVKDGRAVLVPLHEGDLRGWVYGSDDYHWGIVTSDGSVAMVHKSVPCIYLTDILLENEDDRVRALVEPVVFWFRDYVMKSVFKQQTAAAASSS